MTAVAVLSRILAGQSRKSPTVRAGVQLLSRELPRWQERKGRSLSRINFYYWYYGSYAMHQYGGKAWKKWSAAMVAALGRRQRRGGDEDGSWDSVGEWGAAGGRVYATALGALTFEVYYRYRRVRTY